MKAVVVLGGVFFDHPDRIDLDRLNKVRDIVLNSWRENVRVHLVTGGGPLARSAISLVSRAGGDKSLQDYAGINVTYLNALFVSSLFGDMVYKPVPRNFEELLNALSSDKLVVCGGLFPAQSTDMVGALMCEVTGAKLLVKATDVDGVYDKDPEIYPDAKKFDSISISNFTHLILGKSFSPGKYDLLDLVAVKILGRSGIECIIVDGRNPDNIENALKGRRVGSKIIP